MATASAGRFFDIPHFQNPMVYGRILTVVKHSGFYYGFNTFYVPDLPILPHFSYLATNSTICEQNIVGKLRQIGAEYGVLGGFSFMIKVLFICHCKMC